MSFSVFFGQLLNRIGFKSPLTWCSSVGLFLSGLHHDCKALCKFYHCFEISSWNCAVQMHWTTLHTLKMLSSPVWHVHIFPRNFRLILSMVYSHSASLNPSGLVKSAFYVLSSCLPFSENQFLIITIFLVRLWIPSFVQGWPRCFSKYTFITLRQDLLTYWIIISRT